MKLIYSFVIGATLAFTARAQQTTQLNSSEILLGIQKLKTVGSVLYIAAHPDDENTRLLAYLSNERHLRTAYLSLTRGDGGQNLIGKEQGEALGVIRTQELLAARRTDGAEQMFTRANDFGYSKNPEETFGFWNRDSILSDVVWAIRKFRPDVIICRFPTTGEGGHGHHTASALLAVEAFDAAGDPKRFPDQLKYVSTCKPHRIFWNTFNFGGFNNTPSDPSYLKIDVGAFNPLLGKGYGEIAADSRTMHKSQGFGSARKRGEDIEQFKWLKGSEVKIDLFEGIDQSWNRLKEGKKMTAMVDECIKNFDLAHPEKSVPALVNMYKYLSASTKNDAEFSYWRQQKLAELEKLIVNCAGVWAEAFVPEPSVVPGSTVAINPQIVVRNPVQVKLKKITYLQNADTLINTDLKTNVLTSLKHKEKISETMVYSNPYWLNEVHSNGLYTVSNRENIGQPENAPSAIVGFTVDIAGQEFILERELLYRYTDPVKGDISRRLEIVPPVTVSFPEKVLLFNGESPKQVFVTVKAWAAFKGQLEVRAPQGWKVMMEDTQLEFSKAGIEKTIAVRITPGKESGWLRMALFDERRQETEALTMQRIEYDHIPHQFILHPAEIKLVSLDLMIRGENIAYIPGAGDDVAACLRQVGYKVTELSDDDLRTGNLSGFDAIVTGVRVYNTNNQMPAHHKRLMEYVAAGGNLVVQYNTNSRVGPLNSSIGPYPFTISRDRVTDENAEVRFLIKEHPILHYPNQIDANDFNGWIQERGIYFATERDSSYQAILGMNDAGEKELDGSLITVNYGKGRFVYTGLAFFRELPAGVPGAYRLFVNLLSLPPKNQ